ncbi:MAG: stage II sporulation protein M [Dehalococcoidales bacterium]|nr:stage II sporulation protein M [Dehalococcoidales bacterium]
MNYRKWIFIAILIFGVSLVIGSFISPGIIDYFNEEIEILPEGIAEEIVPFEFITAIRIFSQNVIVLLVSFAFSPIFCLLPVLSLIVNGLVIAIFTTLIMQEASLGFVLVGLLPHGILEMPAYIMGEAAALSFGTVAMGALFKKEKRALVLPGLKQNFRYLSVALLLLIPAAIIETYVTPLLLNLF